MWAHMYKTKYYTHDDFVIFMAEYEEELFAILPLAKRENWKKAFEFLYGYFKDHNIKFQLRGVTKEFAAFLQEQYPEQFQYILERSTFDYVYLAEDLKNLKGKKYHKKRNHINSFLTHYEGLYEYKALKKENLNDCLVFLDHWNANKEDHIMLDYERTAIEKVFDHYDQLNIRVGAIYIGGKIEAFTFADYLKPDMAVIHVEKANPEIRGLYAFINQAFLKNAFPDVTFVNREEDLGIEGLRRAKLSYNPIEFIEKYTVIER
jgi:hypothetical protein